MNTVEFISFLKTPYKQCAKANINKASTEALFMFRMNGMSRSHGGEGVTMFRMNGMSRSHGHFTHLKNHTDNLYVLFQWVNAFIYVDMKGADVLG